MISIRKKLFECVSNAFVEAGFDAVYGEVTLSDRPDLCQYQCNGAFALAKKEKSNPVQMAKTIIEKIKKDGVFKEISIAGAGFINLILEDQFIANHINEMSIDKKHGVLMPNTPLKIIIDYGGPNVGKPLHVGHLRAAIIGESLKRLARYLGHEVIGDVHLGDWGLQMGMIMVELKRQNPDWGYFNEEKTSDFPIESPIKFSDFEETYPNATKRAKDDLAVMEESRKFTAMLQDGNPGLIALWKHFIAISTEELKKSYDKLFVEFDLWNGESDVQCVIPSMIKSLVDGGFAYENQGALVVDVAKEEDAHTIPPFMLSKSDGSSLYSTTDLATISKRIEDFNPNEIWYVVDMRQAMHFNQVFRCAYKTKIASSELNLLHLGFGTMNGTDGKPYKTRDGGVMKLNDLIKTVEDVAFKRIEAEKASIDLKDEQNSQIAHFAGIAALKYADLMNYRTKDYVFDPDRFTSFEGRTGTYLLYSAVRIKSVLKKAREAGYKFGDIIPAIDNIERDLQLELTNFSDSIQKAYADKAPNHICDFVYNVATGLNRFYHEHKILLEENESRRSSWLSLLSLTHEIMSTCLDLLGIKVPERL